MAPGSNVIATAAIGLIPTISGFEKNISAELNGSAVMSQADSAGKGLGSRLGSGITSALKSSLKIAAVVGGAIGAVTVKGGFDRALGIENAQAKMKGLGYDAKNVDTIMSNALSSVEGTAYGLDAAATTAAGAVAAGIKPGEQLEGVLKTVANTAAATGDSMDNIGGIFNTVAAVGSAYTGDIQMLAQRGIPIWQSLSKTLGVSQAEVRKMATEGKIDFATFEAAAKDASGGVATAMGDTTQGAFQNMMASVRKLGAMFVTGILPLAKTTFQGIQGLLNAVKAKLEPFVNGFFERFGGAAQSGIQGFFEGLITWVERFDPTPVVNFFTEVQGGIRAFGAAWEANDGDITSSGFPGFMEKAAYWIRQVWDRMKSLDFSSFQGFAKSLSGINSSGASKALGGVGDSLGTIAKASPGLLSLGLNLLAKALKFLSDNSATIAKWMPVIIAGLVAWKVHSAYLTQAVTHQRAMTAAMAPVMAYNNTLNTISAALEYRTARAKDVSTASTTRATLAERLRTVATKAGALASRAAALAARVFGAALRFAMGPIGWIITGVALLATGLYLFFTKTEIGKTIWASIWGAIKAAVAVVVDWFMNTALPVLKAAWDGIAAGALWLYNNAILPAWNGIKAAISVVAEWVVGTLVPAFQTAWQWISTGALWLYNAVILPVWNGIKVAIAVVVAIVMTYIQAWVWIFQNVLAPVFMWLYQSVILPAWEGIKTAIGVAVAVVMTIIDGLVWLWQNVLAPAAMWLYQNVILPVWNAIQAVIGFVVSAVTAYINAWVWIFNNVLAPVFNWLYNSVILPVWNAIQAAIGAVVGWFQNTAWPLLSSVIGWIQQKFELFKVGLGIIWAFIQNNVINPVVSWFQNTAWPIIQNVIAWIQTAFDTMKTKIGDAWSWVKDKIIQPVADWFERTISPLFTRVTDGIGKAFDTMKTAVGTAWDAIKSAAEKPIKFVVETIVRDGIVKNFNKIAGKFGVDKIDEKQFTVGFRSGGILPGRSRMSDGDDQLVPMRRGEGVLVSEGLRDPQSRSMFLAANAAAKRGVPFSKFMGGGYAGGGIVDWFKDVGGDALDYVKGGAKFVTDVVSDPAGVFSRLADTLVSKVPGGGLLKDLATAVPKSIAKAIGDSLLGGMKASESSAASVPGAAGPVGPTGSGGSLGAAEALAGRMGLRITSKGRRGARTAQNGLVSLHALGRAIDVAGPNMMAYFNAVDSSMSPTELLYSPAGARNKHRSGRRYPNTGATLKNHFSHVHVGFTNGGIVPYLHDNGGWHMPGELSVNQTQKPEAVLTDSQWRTMSRVASTSLSGDGRVVNFNYQPTQANLDEQVEHRTRREFEAMMFEARKVMPA